MLDAPLLELADIETSYGLSRVLFGISLAIAPGEMVSLMGRNGMGKTTTVRSIMGLTRAAKGSIRFAGSEIRALAAYRIAQRGIGRRGIGAAQQIRQGEQLLAPRRPRLARHRASAFGRDISQIFALARQRAGAEIEAKA